MFYYKQWEQWTLLITLYTGTLYAGEFSIATVNVLHENFYARNTGQAMPLDERMDIFNQNMPDDLDIVCMQEVPYDIKNIYSTKFFAAVNMKYPQHAYEHVAASFGKFKAIHGPYVIFNPRKFQKLKGPWTSFLECSSGTWNNGTLSCNPSETITKACLTVILKHNDTGDEIGVINAHIPFVNNNLSFDSLNIIKNVVSKNAAIKKWIICGDFNYDTYKNEEKYKSLKNALLNWPSNRDQGAQKEDYTACNVHNDNKMFMDYIFYENLKPAENVKVIPSFDRLIRHKTTTGQYYKNYFSDHAIVIMKFLLDKHTQQKQAATFQDVTLVPIHKQRAPLNNQPTSIDAQPISIQPIDQGKTSTHPTPYWYTRVWQSMINFLNNVMRKVHVFLWV